MDKLNDQRESFSLDETSWSISAKLVFKMGIELIKIEFYCREDFETNIYFVAEEWVRQPKFLKLIALES